MKKKVAKKKAVKRGIPMMKGSMAASSFGKAKTNSMGRAVGRA